MPFTEEERAVFDLLLEEKTYIQMLFILREKGIFLTEHTIPLRVKKIREKLKREDLL